MFAWFKHQPPITNQICRWIYAFMAIEVNVQILFRISFHCTSSSLIGIVWSWLIGNSKSPIELASLISYQVLRSPTSSVTFKKGRNKHNKYKVCVCVYTRTYTYVTFQYLFVCKIYVCVHICIYVNDDHRSFPHPHGPWGISKTPKLLRFRTNVGLFEVQCHTSANLRSLGAIQKTVLRDLYLSN